MAAGPPSECAPVCVRRPSYLPFSFLHGSDSCPASIDRERTLRFDDSDRRRLVLASALTVAALPAVWLVNQDDEGSRPNVAAVGLAAENGAADTASTTPPDPMGEVDARYLAGTSLPPPPQPASVAVGSTDQVVVATAQAIYRRSVGRVDSCQYNGVRAGQLITVVNVDNGRSIECWTTVRPPDGPADELVMHPDRFIHIADLTSAPINVEIRQ